ncbi:MAG: biotin/lipoyl-binding protein [Clostridia bacterium]|nr:biotin/lipoyl-binding protein [Clostridia bacterium]
MKKKICLLFLAVCMALCGAAQAEVPELLEPAGIELDYAAAQAMDLYTVTLYNAAVIPYTEDLWFEVDGTVEQVHVHLGSRVQKGDALITLDEEALMEQEAELLEEIAYTKQVHANANELSEIDIRIATVRLDSMRANGSSETAIVQAEANIDMMELKLAQTKAEQAITIAKMEKELAKVQEKIGRNVLVAPFDGVVVSIDNLRAEYGVAAYEPVIRLADETQLLLSSDYIGQNTVKGANDIYALIGSRQYALEYVPVEMDEYLTAVFSEAPLKTKFTFAGEHADVACGEYAAICVVTGMVEDALCIPCNALYSDNAGRYVYKLDEDGQRVRVNVHTGSTNGLYFQITDGLEEGDLVYVKE